MRIHENTFKKKKKKMRMHENTWEYRRIKNTQEYKEYTRIQRIHKDTKNTQRIHFRIHGGVRENT